MSIQTRINGNLQAFFNTEHPRYKALICDLDGTNPTTVNKPTDIDIGVIASQIEYLRWLSIDLAKQMYIDEASGVFLRWILEEFFASLQLEDETDAEWVQRTIATVFQQKLSNATIIYSLRPYSTTEPEIQSIITESAYADFSFADVYSSAVFTVGSETVNVLPAIAENYESAFFSIKIVLTNTASADIFTVQEIIDKMVAAGIDVTLQVNYA